jgi:choline dehydrogenase-like flavoprotein
MSNDIIIIDSGAYGGALAEHLVPSVESILLLEHGNQDLSERKTGG